MSTRRQFLAGALAAGALSQMPPFAVGSAQAKPSKSKNPLKMLILGGTAFLGPATINHALARGHEITLFNRGRTNTHLFPKLEKLVGDRDGDLKAIEGRKWDVVLDTSGYIPRVVTDSAKLLADHCKHYIFVSSVSAYADFATPGMDEDYPVARLDDKSVEEVNGDTYGGLKVLCEEAAEKEMPGRVTIVRPGLIAGPMDRTDRFTYWPQRIAKGGDVFAPGDPHQWMQFIDVRDLGEFIVKLFEDGTIGTFNADRPPRSCTTGLLMHACKAMSESDARFQWAPVDFMDKHEVGYWGEMPVYFPSRDEFSGWGQLENKRAAEAGLHCRSVEETVTAILAWWLEQDEERRKAPKAGLAPEREAELLAALKARP